MLLCFVSEARVFGDLLTHFLLLAGMLLLVPLREPKRGKVGGLGEATALESENDQGPEKSGKLD